MPQSRLSTRNSRWKIYKRQLEGQQKSVVSSEVKRLLGNVQEQRESAETLRMLPAYVRSFFEDAAPLLGYRINGDIEADF